MCSFLCPNTIKIIQNVCKRNLHSIIQVHNAKFCSLPISAKTVEINFNITKFNLFHFNRLVRCNSDSANTKTETRSGSENILEEEREGLYSNVDYDAIANGDESLLKKLKILMLEVEVMIQEGHKVPSKLTTSEWKNLLDLETRSARKKFLGFLFINEIKKSNRSKKKVIKQKIMEEKRTEELERTGDHIRYGFRGSTIFLRIYPSTIDNFYNNRLIRAMQLSQDIVIDCSYDSYMTQMEVKNCAKQMMFMFADNRSHDEPFNLHFCNADPKSRGILHLHKYIPTMYDSSFPMNITEKSYLDIFPKEKLVYLTPHCRNELTTFNHDDIYIIGAMVDKANNDALSLAKAKSEGLRMACLPLDKHLLWQLGSKSLTLNQVLLIMLDIRKTGSWKQALVHVPTRKLIDRQDKNRRQPLKGIWQNNIDVKSILKG